MLDKRICLMLKIAFIGYRSWAKEIYTNVQSKRELEVLSILSKDDFSEQKIINFNPDLVLFYGWSWIIEEDLLVRFKCLMLHPSPLPKYRGGSPIQNQIISGEVKSKVSIFIMNNAMDAGDLVGQSNYSLEGSLDSIFERIISRGTALTLDIIDNGLKPVKQDHKEATYCKRRKPEESEITLSEIKNKDSIYIYNKIRMLADPYPNAFIKTIDGKKIFIKDAFIVD